MTSFTDIKSLISYIKDRHSIRQVFQSLGVTHINSYGKAPCIFHEDKDPSLEIYEDTNSFYCFGCKKGGDILNAVGFYFNSDSVIQQIKKIEELFGENYLSLLEVKEKLPEQITAFKKQKEEDKKVSEILKEAFIYFNETIKTDKYKKIYKYLVERFMGVNLSEEVVISNIDKYLIGFNDGNVFSYLQGKGFSSEEILSSGLFYQAVSGTITDCFQKRIMFPYWENGNIVYGIGRETELTKDNTGKYKKLIQHSDKHPYSKVNNVLFNRQIIKQKKNKLPHLIIGEGIVEGYICVFLEIPFISPITSNFKKTDVEELMKITEKVNTFYIVVDNEENKEGIKGGLATARPLFQNQKNVFIVIPPKKKEENKIDLADFLQAHHLLEFDKLCEGSQDFISYLISGVPSDTPPLRALSLLEETMSLLSCKRKHDLTLYAKLIAEKTDMTPGDVKSKIYSLKKDKNTENNEYAGDEFTRAGYKINEEDKTLTREMSSLNGPIDKKISSFMPVIEKEIINDDGRDGVLPKKEFEGVICFKGNRKIPFQCSPADLVSEQKIRQMFLSYCGMSGSIEVKEERFLTHAMELYSRRKGELKVKRVYKHTGWDRGKNIYLFPGYNVYPYKKEEGGNLKKEEEISVVLEGDFNRLRFEDIPEENLREIIEEGIFEGVLKSNDYAVTIPCIATVFLAPISAFTGQGKKYFLWIYGTTGKQKTTFATLLSCFYGNFAGDEDAPLESWKSSPSSIERTGFILKDSLVLIDEYKKMLITKQHLTLIQTYSDGNARRRCTSTMELLKTFPVRAYFMSTGEDIPTDDAAIYARLLPVEVLKPGDFDRINIARRYSDKFKGIIPHFIKWAANAYEFKNSKKLQIMYETIREDLVIQINKLAMAEDDWHKDPASNLGRIATNMALNKLGLTLFIEYCHYLGVKTEYLREIQKQYKKNFDFFVMSYMTGVTQESGATIFVNTLQDLLSSEKVFVENDLGNNEEEMKMKSSSVNIGFVERGFVYLNPTVAFSEVKKELKNSGRDLKFNQEAIYKQLIEKGAMCRGEDKKSTVPKNKKGKWSRFLKFKSEVFFTGDGIKELKEEEIKQEEDIIEDEVSIDFFTKSF